MVKTRVLFFLLLLSLGAWAQSGGGQVTATLSSDSIAMDETATLTISFSGLSGDVDIPIPESRDGGLRFDYAGQRSNMSYINGQSSSSTELDYRVTPVRKGRHLIEEITGNVGGTPFTTRTLRLEVTDAGTGTQRGNAANNGWNSGINGMNPANPWGVNPANPWAQPVFPQDQPEEDVKLEAVVEPETVYKHQPLYYNLRLLVAGRLLSDPRYNPIAPTGFLRLAFPQENSQEERDGHQYNVMSVKTAYFPLSEGEYTLDPSQVSVAGGFFSMPQTLSTEPKTIKVLPLPSEGRPQSFTGAVGSQFEIQAHLKSPQISLGGNTELEVSVKGDGHLDLVPYPFLPEWAGLEKKQMSSPSTTRVENGAIVSSRTYNFRLKPTKEGKYDLSGIALAYFNPTEKRYEVVKAPDLTLQVDPNRNARTDKPAGDDNGVADSERPQESAGPSGGRLPELPLLSMVAGGVLLLAGAILAQPRRRSAGGFRRGAGKTVSAKHKSLPEVMAALETLAPGSDSTAREAALTAKGWNPANIARFEALKRSAGRALFGGGVRAPELLDDLNKELGALLKEARR